MIKLLLSISLLLSSSAFPEDWCEWRGPNRDAVSTETGLLTSWPEEGLAPLWCYEGLGIGYSSPSIAGDRVYGTGMLEETCEAFLFAFDLSGALLWKVPYGLEWKDPYPGTRSMPTVEEDRIYLISSPGYLFCFDAASGTINWKVDLATQFKSIMPVCGLADSVLLVDEKVICIPGGEAAALAAFDKKTGALIWSTEDFSDQSAYCSLIQVERGGLRLAITVTARHIVAVNVEDGTVVWKESFDVDAEDPNHSVTPVYADGLLYVTSGHRDGGLCYELAPDGKSISLKWEDSILNTLSGGLVILDGYLYGTNARARWLCLDLKTGEVQYEDKGVGKGSMIVAENHLYCYGEKGTLALVPVNPAAYEITSSFKIKVGKGPHWSHPVIANGRLYIRHENALMAFDIQR